MLRQEAGVMHGAVVDNLEQSVVFVLDVEVVEVNETICAAGEQDVFACGVEL